MDLTEYNNYLSDFHTRVNLFRKNHEKSDNKLDIIPIKKNSIYGNTYLWFVVREGWKGQIIGRLYFKNYETRVNEIAKESASYLDNGVGKNERDNAAFVNKLKKTEQTAKSIDGGLESYNGGNGIHGKINGIGIVLYGSNIQITLYDKNKRIQLMKDIASLIRNKYSEE